MNLILNKEAMTDMVGNFDKEEAKLKQLARKGQMLSSSTFITRLEQEEIQVVKDIEKGEFVFSDGCGYICQNLLQ